MGLFDSFKQGGINRDIKINILEPDKLPLTHDDILRDLKAEVNGIVQQIQEINRKIELNQSNVLERLKQVETLVQATKDSVLERLQTSSSALQTHQNIDEKEKIRALVDKLSQKEKKLFSLLLQSGALTYEEIGNALNISPTTARGLVHRIMSEPEKAQLFTKVEDDSGSVKIALHEEIEHRILKPSMPVTTPIVVTVQQPNQPASQNQSSSQPQDKK